VIQRVRSLLEATRTDRVVPPSPVAADTNFPRPRATSPLWPLLSAPLVVADHPLPLPRVAEARREWEEPTALYRAAALPRVFWAGAWSSAPDEALADAMLLAARGDRAVLAPDAPPGFPAPGAPEGPVAAARVAVEGGALEAEVVAPRAGVAVVLEPWFPGWTATVDGAPAPLARADFAFMAVPLPAGRHLLRLGYAPTQLGRGVAAGGAALTLLVAALALRRRGRAPTPASPP
jgi:hypothetical protein